MALVCSLGAIRKSEGRFLIGYDDIFSIQYFGRTCALTGIGREQKQSYLNFIRRIRIMRN